MSEIINLNERKYYFLRPSHILLAYERIDCGRIKYGRMLIWAGAAQLLSLHALKLCLAYNAAEPALPAHSALCFDHSRLCIILDCSLILDSLLTCRAMLGRLEV